MKTQYFVYMRCVVNKIVTCEGCTKEQARKEPFEFAVYEMETDMEEWQVTRVDADVYREGQP